MHILNEKVDGIGKLLNKAPLVESRPGTHQGPVHMPFINPNAQSALFNIQNLHNMKPYSLGGGGAGAGGSGINTHPPYVPPHLRSQILTNHVWVCYDSLLIEQLAQIKNAYGNCVKNVEGEIDQYAIKKQMNQTELKVMIIENDPRMLSFLNDYQVDGDRQKLYANFLSLAKSAIK